MASYGIHGHRSNQSLSLQPPPGGMLPGSQQRRMTVSAMSSQSSLSLPDGGRQSSRPPSPLRNAFTFNSSTGVDGDQSFASDDEDDDDAHPSKWKRSPSPSSSVSNLAASFVQRVNNFVGNMAPRSPGALPSDAELEAEAERERERSRREAEAILTREAQQRKQVEERVLAMLGSTQSLPPPPSRAATMPPTTPSPSGSHKESSSWWQTAKNKFTPTKEKESPTPAQQVILDAKARDKKGKGKEEEAQWTAQMQQPIGNLNIPVQPPQRKPVPASPSSPTPSRPNTSVPNLSPSPMRGTDSMANSPSREAPPMYAQFTPQGTLDVPATLLAIAKRFEKLEKWTIGHVRALEDRMNDVERWLVDKEKEKEKEKANTPNNQSQPDNAAFKEEMNEIRDEISELQGRVGELGREMAKMATAPSNLSSGPKSQTVNASVSIAPRQASTQLVHEDGPPILPPIVPDLTGTPRHTRLSSTALDTTSPPLASNNRTPSGTKLPYPTGDYNSPPDAFSPPNSPPASINSKFRKSSSISGLPSSAYPTPVSSTLNRPTSPPSTAPLSSSLSRSPNTARTDTARTESPTPNTSGLPPPKPKGNFRQSSVSPTPRKRYTVALGGPIVAPPDLQSNEAEPVRRVGTPNPRLASRDRDQDEEDEEDDGGETIGKSAAARLTRSLATKRSTTSLNSVNSYASDRGGGAAEDSGTYTRGRGDYKSPPSPTPMSNRRLRAQSAYGYSAVQAQSSQFGSLANDSTTSLNTNTTAPLRLKVRTRSTERLGGGSGGGGEIGPGPLSAGGITTATGGKFVDPLVLRRQEAAATTSKPIAMPKPLAKGSIGQLVAFFDKDKK
ncbi:hypothetical protein CC1G_07527 [Coprinopsis cinerea okayama7|uniref:Uncharacterized protein n=1 Tax=Coprinopsis cinerea (strain Okayama-7 / 130 / ATCC MYA-4618 / FGSC 9003) TaxID=240176 RepID=A8P171_COPC7|nr:hypothetical protein CC1G_07527 [Coprinopsis cinerea okayama7\|eukprot:XP_001838037.2 hypothetical protein CC1G_07527 [Coprinopsis cinerea okayama7\